MPAKLNCPTAAVLLLAACGGDPLERRDAHDDNGAPVAAPGSKPHPDADDASDARADAGSTASSDAAALDAARSITVDSGPLQALPDAAEPSVPEAGLPDTGSLAAPWDAGEELPIPRPPSAVADAGVSSGPLLVGGGGGGQIYGSVIAYAASATQVSNVKGVTLFACFTSPPYDECDRDRSVALLFQEGSLRGNYVIDGLADHEYMLLGYKDQSGDGKLGPGDWFATFSMDGRTTTLLAPPVENVHLHMKPIELDGSPLPAPQLWQLAGTWGSRMGDSGSATMHLYADGTYDFTQTIDNSNPGCSLAGFGFDMGNVTLDGTKLTFLPSSPNTGAVGGTCGVGAIGARRNQYFVELWIDEIGRPALILRASMGRFVFEDVYLEK